MDLTALLFAFSKVSTFVFDLCTYLWAFLLFTRIRSVPELCEEEAVGASFAQALRQLWGHQLLRAIVWFAPMLNLCLSGQLTTAYSVLATQDRGEFWLGTFQSSYGVLGLIGATGAAMLVTRWSGGLILMTTTSIFALEFLVLSLRSFPPTYFVFLGLLSLCLPVFNAVLNGCFMATVPRHMIGTASSIMMVTAMGLMPVGSALAGYLVDHWGAAASHGFFAALFALAAGGFLSIREVRTLPGADRWGPEKEASDAVDGS